MGLFVAVQYYYTQVLWELFYFMKAQWLLGEMQSHYCPCLLLGANSKAQMNPKRSQLWRRKVSNLSEHNQQVTINYQSDKGSFVPLCHKGALKYAERMPENIPAQRASASGVELESELYTAPSVEGDPGLARGVHHCCTQGS